jgi:hypothetical protein
VHQRVKRHSQAIVRRSRRSSRKTG